MIAVEEKYCGICEIQKITHKGIQFCALCDNPPNEEGLWFVYWCLTEPE